MAYNKECLIVILDVRQNAAKELKRRSIQCVADVLKEKIGTSKKDYISFILMGTERTENDAHSRFGDDSYLHIVQYPDVVVPSWNVLIDFMKFVSEPSSNEGDWVEALAVALELMRSSAETFKFRRPRLLLFHDFDAPNVGYDYFDMITTHILESEVQLMAASLNVQYIDNAETGEPQAVFRPSEDKPHFQRLNEKYALRLVSDCNAKLYNFQDVLYHATYIENRRPWCWNTQLSIGSKLCLRVSCLIAMKDESHVQMRKCYGGSDDEAKCETKYYLKGAEIQPLDSDLIEAYMLGSTPVPFDEPLKLSDELLDPGFKFYGFIKSGSVPPEYYCGDALYWMVHRKGMQSSAKMMDALVRALVKTQMSILCWKVHSLKFNNPKMVLLQPNEIRDDRPASLSIVELVYYDKHLFWDFPRLGTKKNECTPEQLDAIDELIDSMDLMVGTKAPKSVREKSQKDLLPFDMLPDVHEKSFLDMLERKVLSAVGRNDPYIQDLVAEKNYEDVFWRVPEDIEEKAKQAANKVKELFPLSRNVVSTKASAGTSSQNQPIKKAEEKGTAKASAKQLECVGCSTPAEDFEMLLKQEVLTLQDCTLRDAKFHCYVSQLRDVIWQLLFAATSSTIRTNTIAEALKVLRKSCYDFNAFAEYNDWIRKVKAQVIKAELFDFWKNCVVRGDLGLCFVDVPLLEEKLVQEEFYKIDTQQSDDSGVQGMM